MASMLNSLPTLWMLYLILSLIVLVMGWLGTRWLPRTLQWALVGMVAGLCWMPWSFHEAASVSDGSFSGSAPAVVIALMDVMRHRTGAALLVVLLAVLIGGAVGVLFGTWRVRHSQRDDKHHAALKATHPAQGRRDPTL